MALIPSINLCLKSNCVDLVFKETTGLYSLSNLGGYGSPNNTTGSVTSAVLVITAPDSTEYTIDMLATTFFPTSNTLYEFIIPLSDIGSPVTVADGYWTFVYTVTAPDPNTGIPASFVATSALVVSCAANCCIANMLAQIKLNTCPTCDSLFSYEDYVKAVSLRDSMQEAANCGDAQYITDTLNILTKLCNKVKCNNCN